VRASPVLLKNDNRVLPIAKNLKIYVLSDTGAPVALVKRSGFDIMNFHFQKFCIAKLLFGCIAVSKSGLRMRYAHETSQQLNLQIATIRIVIRGVLKLVEEFSTPAFRRKRDEFAGAGHGL
jgi:hypothetical protein